MTFTHPSPSSGEGLPAVPKRSGVSTKIERDGVLRRLYSAIDRTLTKLEAAMADDEPLTPSDRERETRALNTIIRNVEKVRDLERGKRKPSTATAKRTGRTAAGAAAGLAKDPEILRLELAERILRLRVARPKGEAKRDPDGTGG